MGMFKSEWFSAQGDTVSLAGMHRVVTMPAKAAPASLTGTQPPVRVIYASETGVAEHLAHDTLRSLQHAGVACTLLPFDELDLEMLKTIGHALFVVSTCYDGDPPDMAEEFCRQCMGQPVPLPHLRYGLLSLGDSYYDEFCGFGRQLHQWLQAGGAQTLFEPVEMDDEDEDAARRWHENVDVVIRLRRGGAKA